MNHTSTGFLLLATRALTIGMVAGLRSMTPLAILALRRDSSPASARWRDWPVLNSGKGRGGLIMSGLGETVGDKLPTAPSRLKPLPLTGRMVFGGVAGAAISSESKGTQPILIGALIGAFGGLLGSFAGYHIRHAIVSGTKLPDLIVALGEDAIAIALAAHATKLD
jgi:uncharacterized membrane protein